MKNSGLKVYKVEGQKGEGLKVSTLVSGMVLMILNALMVFLNH